MSTKHWLFPQVADPTPKRVQRLLRPIFPILWQSVMGPWREFLYYRTLDADLRDYSKGEVAKWLHPKIVRCAKRLCVEWARAGHKDLSHGELNGMFFLRYQDEIAVVYKKVIKHPSRFYFVKSVVWCKLSGRPRNEVARWRRS